MEPRIVAISKNPPIATATLNLSDGPDWEQVAYAIRDAFANLAESDDIWIVVLTGDRSAFDREAKASPFSGEGSAGETLGRLKTADIVASLDKPVVAALDGDAINQGLEVALACDIRVATRNARFGLTQVKDGTMPWDGGTQRLPRLIGRSRALEMILTSRVIDAQEALDIGLVNEVVEEGQALVRAEEIASEIANHGPIAARYLKEAVSKGMDMTLEQGLRLEADLNLILQSTSDRAEGIGSFLERRSPEYRGE